MYSENDHPSTPPDPAPHLRRNQQITARKVRLFSNDGRDLGIMNTDDARRDATSAGLDLVEIAPKAIPPVCKIFDFKTWLRNQKN